MTEPSTPPVAASGPSPSLISTTLVVYALFGVAAVVELGAHGFPPAAPLGGLAHVKRSEANGTWLASHYRWLIRTFWFSVLWGLVGAVIFVILLIILIGPIIAWIIWFVTAIWVLYRRIRGYVLFKDSQPVPGM